jgi:hypothetical protein
MPDDTSATYAVALGLPGDQHENTIVLGGTVIVIPLEMDPDADPLHDDEVRLWSVRGSYDRTLFVSDADVEPDLQNRMMHYRFRDVPYGVYRVAVCVAGEWHDLMHNLVVTSDGAYLGGKKLSQEKPAMQAAPPDETELDDAPDSDGLDAPEPMDRTYNQSMRVEDEHG